ncbi:hypothetical protein [Acidithrix ferrooxidans]|uniref:Uncharacterized protein n=1 Tax=Acidithrix ferrooxidans TaxID=1280514 RepID=A0A0D8HCL5_9ACTN|nr:hypothetical protein [Acidithrix ferrooxidans]KJF15705.1 hypothetical protein AXFE_34580 [Acidithrix ferrooxidans]
MTQRKPGRGQQAFNDYRQAKRDAAKTYRSATRQRQDDSRNCAKSVVMDQDRLGLEDIKAKFLAKTTMAEKAADAAIGSAKSVLVFMTKKDCRDLQPVEPRWTMMDCSRYGSRTMHLLTCQCPKEPIPTTSAGWSLQGTRILRL